MFNCEQCGLCCNEIKCSLLIKGNICLIYLTRPELCNVDKSYQKIKDKMSKEKWYQLNKDCCKILQRRKI